MLLLLFVIVQFRPVLLVLLMLELLMPVPLMMVLLIMRAASSLRYMPDSQVFQPSGKKSALMVINSFGCLWYARAKRIKLAACLGKGNHG
ncbi:MAG: hypothetical protein CSB48_01985 [Proteobacteria bacterium]|nr:MAG: hypothetical protein CSB48_01985 [Pseudomonadota bacterium]